MNSSLLESDDCIIFGEEEGFKNTKRNKTAKAKSEVKQNKILFNIKTESSLNPNTEEATNPKSLNKSKLYDIKNLRLDYTSNHHQLKIPLSFYCYSFFIFLLMTILLLIRYTHLKAPFPNH